MKCPHCEYERAEAFTFCPMCGKPATKEDHAITICPTPRILSFIKDDLFLAICIILTASVGCSMISGGFNALFLLITIFAWLTYAGGKNNVVEHKHIKVISGSVYAIYVINNVLAIITAVCGVIYTILMLIPPVLDDFNISEQLLNINPEEYGPLAILPFTFITLISAFAMFLGILLIIISIIMLFINVAGRKKIHRFVQSVYKSAEVGEETVIGASQTRVWLIIFAVITIASAISAIGSGNVFGFLSEGGLSAAYIILNILIGKHFCDK